MKTIYTLICSLLLSTWVSAQLPCSLDNTFDTDGKLVSDGSRIGEHILVQPDGKIIIACNPFSGSGLIVKRLNVNGSLDNTFGTSGSCTPGINRATGMCFYNGNIYLCGTYSSGGNPCPAVIALTGNGAILNSFNGGVVKTLPSLYTCEGMTMDNSGNIYLTGAKEMEEMYVAKLSNSGSMDNTFDGDGITTLATGNVNHWYTTLDIAVDGTNKVVVTGKKYKANNGSSITPFQNLLVARFLPNGTPDNTFATSGMALLNSVSGNYDEGMRIHVISGNNYIITGSSYDNNDYDYTVLRLLNNGSTDNSFGVNGWVLRDLDGTNEMEYSLNSAVLQDGRILVTGNQGSGDTVYFCMLMLNPDGSNDNIFAPAGVFKHIFNVNNNSSSSGLALDASGKIVLGGYTRTCTGGTCGPLYMAISRYNSSYKNVGINEEARQSVVLVYPNPCKTGSSFSIRSSDPIEQIRVTDCFGKVVATDRNAANSFTISNGIPGHYFCLIQTRKGKAVEKITVIK